MKGWFVMKKILFVLCVVGLVAFQGFSMESPKRAAIFVANRSGAVLNDQLPIFEDMMIAQVTDLGFEVISREVVLNAVGDLQKKETVNKLDALLSEQTSALRLSQNLGADYLLFVTLVSLDEEQRSVNAYGVTYDNHMYTLRASYRILDGNTGASLTAGMVAPTRMIQQTKQSQTSTTGLVRELLAKASREMAANLGEKNSKGAIRTVDVAKEQVEFQISIALNDVQFPELILDAEGRAHLSSSSVNVQPLAVAVDLDGFTIGSTGTGAFATLNASPGLHRIRLAREDLVPVERMVNIHEGMTLNMTMQLTDEARAKWQEDTLFLDTLKRRAELTDAEVERIRGFAQMLRQSGYKVDIKVDTDEGIKVKQNQSLFNQD